MREEPALTRDKILSYSLTAPVIDNVQAGPEVAGAVAATGAASPGEAMGAAATDRQQRRQGEGQEHWQQQEVCGNNRSRPRRASGRSSS